MQVLLIAGTALFASVIGGVSGYGSGALMPLVLVPIVGPEPVVPILSISALFNNTSRAAAFVRMVDWRRAAVVLPCALPATVAGAWIYTRLTKRPRRRGGDRRDAHRERAATAELGKARRKMSVRPAISFAVLRASSAGRRFRSMAHPLFPMLAGGREEVNV